MTKFAPVNDAIIAQTMNDDNMAKRWMHVNRQVNGSACRRYLPAVERTCGQKDTDRENETG